MVVHAEDGAVRAVRGRVVEIAAPDAAARAWIFAALQRSEIYTAFTMRDPPTREAFEAGILELRRGPEVRQEGVRYHIVRRLDDGRPIGFVLDFGWDHPSDSVREIDLCFPDSADRGIDSYFDTTSIIGQYLFVNKLAKRVRWRVKARAGGEPSRGARHGGRLLSRFEERHPVTGAWQVTYIYEYARADFERLLAERGVSSAEHDYGTTGQSLWGHYRVDSPEK